MIDVDFPWLASPGCRDSAVTLSWLPPSRPLQPRAPEGLLAQVPNYVDQITVRATRPLATASKCCITIVNDRPPASTTHDAAPPLRNFASSPTHVPEFWSGDTLCPAKHPPTWCANWLQDLDKGQFSLYNTL